jgi:hypothetical protein
MKKALICLVIAGLALVSVPVVAEACSSHGAVAASSLRQYLGGSNNAWFSRGRNLGDDGLSRNDVDGFRVEGSQYMVDGNWSNRTYWVRITDPFGQAVEFQTTYGGSFRRGVAAEYVLVQAGIDYISNYFADPVASGTGDDATPKTDYNG